MLYARFSKDCIKWTFLFLAYVLVGKLRAIVGLNRLYFKWKCLLQHSEKFNRIFRCMLLKSINKADSCAFINRSPLIQMLSVTFQCASQTAVRHFLNINLNLFARNKKLRITPVMLSWRLFRLLRTAMSRRIVCTTASRSKGLPRTFCLHSFFLFCLPFLLPLDVSWLPVL